ncbi:ankyrin repeat domain-containing protein [Gymnodinialimonas sp. 2305UL16-5]|uniref:ankyrin repeat domain-containing protein n=1 Tax=Gymnodinialimonas mytili TaxID=3126503 RepID=UPI00309D7399
MIRSIDQLRRDATVLKKAYRDGDRDATTRVSNYRPRAEGTVLRHADFLHVIAREMGFASWPHLKAAADLHGMDRATRRQRLGQAIHNGHFWMVDQLLAEMPDLAAGHLGLLCGLYDVDGVRARLDTHPQEAVQPMVIVPPLMHLARSKMIHHWPDREAAMLDIAEMLVAQGADVNGATPLHEGSTHMLSTLYFAIGHAGNIPLARWLLEHGADPNDGESLYHSTELGHRDGLRLLLEHGADPLGTNALMRAMDFHDVEAVKLLLGAGARVDDFNTAEVGGEQPWVVPALHQAARRMSPPDMVDLLLTHGADATRIYRGVTPYAYARIFGNIALADRLETQGHATPLSPVETLLARIAEGEVPDGQPLEHETLREACRDLLRMILHLPGKLPHLQRLVAAGADSDCADAEGLTPVQIAGWEGLPEAMAFLLRQKPDLGHINGYGGNLFSTILHGAQNNPARNDRDYIACLELALQEGVGLPRAASDLVGDPEIAAFLRDWAATHPEQLVEGGPV